MPNLPTLTVSQAHFDRLVNAFPGATVAEKADVYKVWLTNQLIDYVLQVERQRIEDELLAARAAKTDAVLASLPPRPTSA